MKSVKALALIAVTFFFSNCQTDESNELIPSESSEAFINKIAVLGNDRASFLADQLKRESGNGRVSSTALDSVVYYRDSETDLTNFAFLTSNDNVEEFSNVVFLQTDTSYVAYEVVYRPTEAHLNALASENIMFNFNGSMIYQSLETGEPFLTVNYENGLPISAPINGRMPDGNECYPDEAGRLECYTVYVTTNDDGSYTSSTTGIDYNNHNFGEPASSHTDRYTSCMVVDKDFSTCNLTSFNTEGYTTYPQWHGGANSGTLNSGTTPVFEPIDIRERIIAKWESSNIMLTDAFLEDPCAMKVYSDLLEGDIIYEILNNFMEDIFDVNVTLTMDVKEKPYGKYFNLGCADHRQGLNVPIELKKRHLEFGSSISVAKTILHEAIHAHLIYYLKVVQNVEGVDWNDFPELIRYIDEEGNFPGTEQHNHMANKYRIIIESGLRELDRLNGKRRNSTFHKMMAWGGLQETDAWDDLSPQEQADIDSLLEEQEEIGGCQ